MNKRGKIKDFDLAIKIRNNQLVQRREELGMSAPQVAKLMGMSYPTYLWFENMKSKPYRKETNTLREPARKILKFWNASAEEIWPEAVRAIVNNKITKKIEGETALALAGEYTQGMGTSVHRLLEAKETLNGLNGVISTLTPREQEVIRRRFGIGCDPETIENIASDIQNDGARREHDKGLSSERVRQIESKVLRKLRHSLRSKQLRD